MIRQIGAGHRHAARAGAARRQQHQLQRLARRDGCRAHGLPPPPAGSDRAVLTPGAPPQRAPLGLRPWARRARASDATARSTATAGCRRPGPTSTRRTTPTPADPARHRPGIAALAARQAPGQGLRRRRARDRQDRSAAVRLALDECAKIEADTGYDISPFTLLGWDLPGNTALVNQVDEPRATAAARQPGGRPRPHLRSPRRPPPIPPTRRPRRRRRAGGDRLPSRAPIPARSVTVAHRCNRVDPRNRRNPATRLQN
jgi:hypothetical protein